MRPKICFLVASSLFAWVSVAIAAGLFDGTYIGTSLTLTGTSSGGGGKALACQTTAAAPGPLTISNGHAQTKWGDGVLNGDVDPSGKLIMHSGLAGRFEGQVANGTVKGSYQGYCIFALAWQRRG